MNPRTRRPSARPLAVVVALLVALAGSVALLPLGGTAARAATPAPALIASSTAALTTTPAPPAGAIFVGMGGVDTNPGTKERPFRTLAKALTVVKAGGTIVLRDGIYREGATGYAVGGTKYYTGVPANVTIQSYPGEIVWFDGTQRVSSWTKVSTGHYQTSWDASSLCAGAYYSRPPADRSANGPCAYSDAAAATPAAADPLMVFADGKELTQVDSLSKLSPTTFYHDWKAKVVHIGADPTTSSIEVTKFAQAMAFYQPNGLRIHGIGFRRYASNQYDNATGASLLINGGTGVLLEKLVVRENAGAGVLVWNSRNLTVRSSMIYRNGANGLNVSGSAKQVAANPSVRDDLTVEYSRIDENNRGGFGADCTFSCSSAGSKASGLVGGNIRYNSFSKNDGGRASGFWCDLDCRQVNVYGNRVVGNARHGILYEVSSTGSIFSNLVVDNGWNSTVNGGGWGLMLSAADTKVYNNTFADNRQGVFLYDDDRSPQSSTGYDASRVGPNSTGIEFVNNVVTTKSTSSGPLLRVQGGSASVPGNTSALQAVSVLNRNAFAKPASTQFALWRDRSGDPLKVFTSLAALRAATSSSYMTAGQLVTSTMDPFVTSDGQYRTTSTASAGGAGTALPSSMAAQLGVSTSAGTTLGVIQVTK